MTFFSKDVVNHLGTDASSGEVKRCQRMRDKLLELPVEIDKDSSILVVKTRHAMVGGLGVLWLNILKKQMTKLEGFFFLAGYSNTVDGSGIWLTSWYGEWDPFFIGFHIQQVVVRDFFH